jgi:hypothetical protein
MSKMSKGKTKKKKILAPRKYKTGNPPISHKDIFDYEIPKLTLIPDSSSKGDIALPKALLPGDLTGSIECDGATALQVRRGGSLNERVLWMNTSRFSFRIVRDDEGNPCLLITYRGNLGTIANTPLLNGFPSMVTITTQTELDTDKP